MKRWKEISETQSWSFSDYQTQQSPIRQLKPQCAICQFPVEYGNICRDAKKSRQGFRPKLFRLSPGKPSFLQVASKGTREEEKSAKCKLQKLEWLKVTHKVSWTLPVLFPTAPGHFLSYSRLPLLSLINLAEYQMLCMFLLAEYFSRQQKTQECISI